MPGNEISFEVKGQGSICEDQNSQGISIMRPEALCRALLGNGRTGLLSLLMEKQGRPVYRLPFVQAQSSSLSNSWGLPRFYFTPKKPEGVFTLIKNKGSTFNPSRDRSNSLNQNVFL